MGTGEIECAKRKIGEVIKNSSVEEDPIHSRNTLKWVRELCPNPDLSLILAALGHDIERAVGNRVKREDYNDYDSFKLAHAERSARILKDLLRECGVEEKVCKKVEELVRLHEIGGNKEADILNWADSLSFFEVNLPFYFRRNGEEEAKKRFMWGLKRLPPHLRAYIRKFKYEDKNLQELVEKWLA